MNAIAGQHKQLTTKCKTLEFIEKLKPLGSIKALPLWGSEGISEGGIESERNLTRTFSTQSNDGSLGSMAFTCANFAYTVFVIVFTFIYLFFAV